MGWWPFGQHSFLDREDEEWQRDTWGWLLAHLGGIDALRSAPLVTPSPAFFPRTEAKGHELAEEIFALVKRHAGMAQWHCRLVLQLPRPDLRVGEPMALKPVSGGDPAGAFSVEGNEVVITYDPAALTQPTALVATFAHELAHYRLASRGAPPGGAQTSEFATDLTTVYLGFGLFGANSAFTFQQHQSVMLQGWSWSRLGYLDQRNWCFALAVFLALRKQPLTDARPFLRPHLFADLGKASRYLARRPQLLAALRRG
jgi:hypothetical protein